MVQRKLRESETTELKTSTSELKEAIKSMAAMLNKHCRGEVYFGVSDRGEVKGQTVTAKTLRDVSRAVSNHIEPKVFPKIKEVSIEGKTCIHVQVSGENAPYYAYGRAHIRVGEDDRQLSAEKIEQLILKKNREKLRWDKEVCREAKLSDISTRKLRQFLKKAELEYTTIGDSLGKLGLLRKGNLTNTALILFSKKPQDFFPNAKLRCAVFGGTDTSVIIDMHDYTGDLFELIEKAEEYILGHINIGMRLEGMRRVDVPEIDKEAFREAIINAFCHRDYYEYDSVNIAIFKDRLEIRSPGELYGNLTIEKIKKEMVSKRRNELIADMFHRVHFVERWGTGIRKILSKEPATDFKEVADIFTTVFRRKTVGITVGKTVGKTRERVILLIKENPRITREELADSLGLSVRGIEWNLRKLKEEGILRREGPRKGGRWVIEEE